MNCRLRWLTSVVACTALFSAARHGSAAETGLTILNESSTTSPSITRANEQSEHEKADQVEGAPSDLGDGPVQDGAQVELQSAPLTGPGSPTAMALPPSGTAAGNTTAKKSTKAKPKKPSGPSPASTAYKTLFFDNDFSYLNKPDNKDFYLGDGLKQLKPLPNTVLDLGGEYRLRDQHEFNMRNSGPAGSNLKGLSDDFLLQRERLFVNYRYEDWFRFYGETINATESFNRDTPRNIEVNPWDALNLFAEVKLIERDGGEGWVRGGRQELLYGAERLISPLDWANTRRTFDGAKGYWKGKDWNVDAFWTRPVLPGQHILNSTGPTTGDITHTFDHPDSGQQFFGAYATYKAIKDHVFDAYYLGYLEDKAPNPENAVFKTNFFTNTIGTHLLGKQDNWLYEVEGAYQFGTFGTRTQSAGFIVVGGGYQVSELKWKPTLWTYYDWASGDRDPTSGTHGTFNQLFPLSHKYFGFMDLVARQNIRDLNFQLTATPTKKIRLLAWYHIFQLDQAKDSLYNAQGLAIRTDATGKSGRNVGQELDLTVQYQFSPRTDVLFGYSHFFAGSFVNNTNPPGVNGNADFYYSQWTQRF
jgi:hypothetical protein